jgi:hypothetical protein
MMEGFRIRQGDMRRFKAAFRDTACVLCERPISRGDPIGYLDYYDRQNRFGPLCPGCLDDQGERFSVSIVHRKD